MNSLRLDKKIALITGAAQGIGLACALRFAQEGATVIATDIQDQVGERAFKDTQGKILYRHLDVRVESDWKSTVDWISKEFGRLDILVNNAGVTGFHEPLGPQDPESATLETWRAVHATNLDGVFLGCKHGIALMRRGGGSIINISSRSGIVGIPMAAAYASSKAAVRNHTKSVALYCAQQKYQIRCNSIHPAVILTPMWEPMLGQGEQREKTLKALAADIPLGHVGRPEDVAAAALYLASEDSKYVTGSEIQVDGGILAGAAAAPKAE